MRIDSASIGMDSARSYHASKTSVRRFEITDYQAALTDVSTKEQKTPQEGDTAQNTGEQENSAENTAMTAKDWQSRFLVSSARWDMRSSASEQTLSTIREYTVRYIFDLLFPSRNSHCVTGCRKTGGMRAIALITPERIPAALRERQHLRRIPSIRLQPA